MRTLATVNKEHQLVIPEKVARALNLLPGVEIEVEIHDPPTDKEKRLRSERFKAVLEEYRGSMRQQMLDDGHASVNELMADIRPAW